MKRRDLVRGAAVTSAGVLVGVAGFRQLSYGATAGNNKTGGWLAVQDWPLIPIHAVLLHDGRVLTYGTTAGGQQTGKFDYDVWDSGYIANDPGSSPVPDLASDTLR